MKIIDQARREFIAKNIADLGKAILTVGFASYFFEKLTLWLRVSFVTLGIVLIALSIFVHPRKGESK